MSLVALSELLGATVRDASGTVRGRVREIAVAPQDHPTRIAFLVVKTADGERMLPLDALKTAGASVRAARASVAIELKPAPRAVRAASPASRGSRTNCPSARAGSTSTRPRC